MQSKSGITDEERGQIAAHVDMWVKRAFRTDQADPALIDAAIKGIYRAANLAEPRVILVPSPFVMAMAGGIAAIWWFHMMGGAAREATDAAIRVKTEAATYAATNAATYAATNAATNAATYDATYVATNAATYDATNAATYAATNAAIYAATYAAIYAATYVATNAATYAATNAAIYAATNAATYAATNAAIYAATYVATNAATYAATNAATYDATNAAIYAATYDATNAATYDATRDGRADWHSLASHFVGEKWASTAMQAAGHWFNAYQGGNMWAAGDCYLSAARDILGLELPSHAAYAHWEQAAINGGFRWMHPQFCMVSDFPETLSVNARNQAHAEFGPSHRWRDGFSIWHLNGVQVEQWMAETHPDDMDARKVIQVKNVDQRREVIRRMGSERLVAQLDAQILDTETRAVGGAYELLAVEMNHGEPWRFLKMTNQSIGAVHIEAVPRECETVRHAINWRASRDINTEWSPTSLT